MSTDNLLKIGRSFTATFVKGKSFGALYVTAQGTVENVAESEKWIDVTFEPASETEIKSMRYHKATSKWTAWDGEPGRSTKIGSEGEIEIVL